MDKQELQDVRRFDIPFGEVAEEIAIYSFKVIHGLKSMSAYGSILAIQKSNTNDSHDTSKSISELKSS